MALDSRLRTGRRDRPGPWRAPAEPSIQQGFRPARGHVAATGTSVDRQQRPFTVSVVVPRRHGSPWGWPGKPKLRRRHPPEPDAKPDRCVLTQAARHSVTGDPHAIVGHIQNAFFVGDSEPDRGGGSSGMPHDVGQQFANHTENDGVDPTTYWVINIGGDLDTRTLSGRGRQLFYRRPQPNLLKHCRMQLEGGLPQPLRRALQSGQRASDALVAGVTASNSMSS